MALISIPTLYDSAEFMLRLIKENCDNPDDLSRIFLEVGKMLDAKDSSRLPQTLQQLILQARNNAG
jgi:hypothetical protein